MADVGLREAARVMRERALAATDGPWWSDENDWCWTLHGVAFRIPAQEPIPEQVVSQQILKAVKDERMTTMTPYWPDAADTAHMVPMLNPAVALAVADWLDAEADAREMSLVARNLFADEVARAYLRGAS